MVTRVTAPQELGIHEQKIKIKQLDERIMIHAFQARARGLEEDLKNRSNSADSVE
jgi:hypothetical protein